jgi:hypothetical protein
MPELPAVRPRKTSYSPTGKQGEYFVVGMVRMLAGCALPIDALHPIFSAALPGLCGRHRADAGSTLYTLKKSSSPIRNSIRNSGARGYRLKPDLLKAQHSMLKYIRTHRAVVRLLLEAGRYLRSVPQAVASKDMSGITASKWTGAARMIPTAVDRERLSQLIQWLEMQIAINTADLFFSNLNRL